MPITLAIGDGANDVSMIQEAHVGVGIQGLEGRQAVNASDFSIPEFQALQRMLLVHGGWNYRRMSKTVRFFLLKNIVFVFCLFGFSNLNGFSGVSPYNSWDMTLCVKTIGCFLAIELLLLTRLKLMFIH